MDIDALVAATIQAHERVLSNLRQLAAEAVWRIDGYRSHMAPATAVAASGELWRTATWTATARSSLDLARASIKAVTEVVRVSCGWRKGRILESCAYGWTLRRRRSARLSPGRRIAVAETQFRAADRLQDLECHIHADITPHTGVSRWRQTWLGDVDSRSRVTLRS
jgi:hypothetical protein